MVGTYPDRSRVTAAPSSASRPDVKGLQEHAQEGGSAALCANSRVFVTLKLDRLEVRRNRADTTLVEDGSSKDAP
jgi:hypothetical protein